MRILSVALFGLRVLAKEGEVWSVQAAQEYQAAMAAKLKANPQLAEMAKSPRGDIAAPFCDVKYCTADALSEGLSSLVASIGAYSRQIEWPPFSELFALVTRVDLSSLSTQIPFVAMIVDFFDEACDSSDFAAWSRNAGKKTDENSYPYCLVNYLRGVHALESAAKIENGIMRQYGQLLRDFLEHEALVNLFTVAPGSACLPVSQLLGLPAGTCEDLRDLFVASAYAQRLAVAVNAEEKQAHGEPASMLQLSAPKADKLRRLHSLRSRIAMVSAFDGFCLQLFREESRHLVEHWYNDPIHKWRYAAGLVNYFTHVAVLLGKGQAALGVGFPQGKIPPVPAHVQQLLAKGVKKDYSHVKMGALVK